MSRNHRHIPIDVFPFPRTARGRFLRKNPADEIDILTTRPGLDNIPLSMPLISGRNRVLIPKGVPLSISSTHIGYQQIQSGIIEPIEPPLNLIVESHHPIIVSSQHIWSLNEYTARPRSTFLQPLHWTRPRSKVLDTTKKNPLKRTQKKMSKGDFQRFHFMSHPWTLWLGEKQHFKGNYGHFHNRSKTH